MPTFICNTRDVAGTAVRRIVDAPSRREAISILREDQLTPIDLKERREGDRDPGRSSESASGDRASASSPSSGRRIKQKDLLRFTSQLGSSTEAGVPILGAITSIWEQMPESRFRDVLGCMIGDIQSGLSLSAAMESHPKVFSPNYINTLRAGEASGTLDQVLQNLSDHLEADLEVRSDVRSALLYPAIVISTLCGAIGVLIVFVVPRFATFYSGMKSDLPLPTRVLIYSTSFVLDYLPLLVLGVAGAVYGFHRFVNTAGGRGFVDRMLLRTPVVGRVIEAASTLQLVQMIGLFTSSGVPMLEGLETIASSATNTKVRGQLEAVAASVASGESLAFSLEDAGCLPPTARQILANGESSGSLERACVSVARQYRKDLRYLTKNLAVMIEPIMTLFLALIVLFVALATFLPMWDMVKVVK